MRPAFGRGLRHLFSVFDFVVALPEAEEESGDVCPFGLSRDVGESPCFARVLVCVCSRCGRYTHEER